MRLADEVVYWRLNKTFHNYASIRDWFFGFGRPIQMTVSTMMGGFSPYK
jgi:hypothetical protein